MTTNTIRALRRYNASAQRNDVISGPTVSKVLSVAGHIVEAMNHNIDVMEREKKALLGIMNQHPELETTIRPKIDSADREIEKARKRIERYYLIKEHYEHENIRAFI